MNDDLGTRDPHPRFADEPGVRTAGLPTLISAELAESREELRRADAKARDLLVVAGLIATVVSAVWSLSRGPLATVTVVGVLVAAVPWCAVVVQLLRVIRPTIIRSGTGGFADPRRAAHLAGMSQVHWQLQRWETLADLVEAKYRRLRRSVDLLLAVGGILAANAVAYLVS